MKSNSKSCVRSAYVLALGVLVAGTAMATDNSKYPAADFSPSVVYRDADLIAKSAGATAGATETHAADPKYPAAYFTPSVIVKAETHAAAAPAPKHDPKYPAAYFEPRLIYPAK